jgi:non-ribosomal peptide synthetase component F
MELMVGLCINTLPVRICVSGTDSVAGYLKRLQTFQVRAREYEYSALMKVQSWSEVPRGTPLFETILVFENYPADAMIQQWFQGKIKAIPAQSIEINDYPLTLTILPGKQLKFICVFRKASFEVHEIRRVLEQMKSILCQMLANAEGQIDDVGLTAEGPNSEIANHQFVGGISR